jgi:hypothetical protein
MRLILSATACALMLAACGRSETPKAEEVSPDFASAHPGHDATAMDASMKAADAADDVAMQATPDGYTFHTFPKKIEVVRLPHDGTGTWSAQGYAEADYFRMMDSRDEPVGGPVKLHAVRFEMLASGNGKVVFEKRASANPNDPVIQALSVNFMIH